MRIAFGPLLLAAVIALPCRAAESTDYSDLWWNPAHNGWGLGLQRQGDVMFATLFIYGTDGTATWLFASDVRPTGATLAWSGKLFRAAGPTFSVPFDGSVGIAEVGNLNLRFDASGKGVLAYTTDGSSVTEPIERMAWRTSIPSGSYYGGMTATAFSCNDPERLDGTRPRAISPATTRRPDATARSPGPSAATSSWGRTVAAKARTSFRASARSRWIAWSRHPPDSRRA